MGFLDDFYSHDYSSIFTGFSTIFTHCFRLRSPGRSCWGADVLSCPPFSAIYHGHVPEPGSQQMFSWYAHHVVGLRRFNLAEPIPLQV